MTVQPTSPFAGPYLTDGVTTEWDFGFKITSAAHLVLRVTDLDGSNAEDVTSGFYVAPSFLGEDTGGTVIYPYPAVALPAGKIIIPYRLIPYSQTTRIGNQGGFQPETHERAFDNLSMQVQQVARDVALATKVELGETAYKILRDIEDNRTLMKVGDEIIGGPDIVALAAEAVVGASSAAAASAIAAANSAYNSASSAASSSASAGNSAASAALANEYAADALGAATGYVIADEGDTEDLSSLGTIMPPLRVRQAIDNYRNAVRPENYAGFGESVAGTTAALQAAAATGKPMLFKNGGTLVVNGEIASPPGSDLVMIGDTTRGGCTIKAAPGFQGFIIKPSKNYELSGFRIEGNGEDGCYGLGTDQEGSATFAKAHDLYISNCDLPIFFDDAWEHPLGVDYRRVYVQAGRSGGVNLGGVTGEATSGESCFDLSGIIITNPGVPGIEAADTVVTVNTPSTSFDRVAWTASGSLYGDVVMRSSDGLTDWHVPPNWENPLFSGSTFDVQKVPGEVWNYKVVRQTVGLSIRRAKVVAIPSVQAEYFGIGIYANDIRGLDIGTFYNERRDPDEPTEIPRPNFAALLLDENSRGQIATGYIDKYSRGIVCRNNSKITVTGVMDFNDLKYPALAMFGATEQCISYLNINITGTTPGIEDYTNASAYNYAYDGAVFDRTNGKFTRHVNGADGGGFQVYRRDVLKSYMQTNAADEGEFFGEKIQIVQPSKTLKAMHVNRAHYTDLTDAGTVNVLNINLGEANAAVALHIPFMIQVSDASFVRRQVASGILVVSLANASGLLSGVVAVAGLAKALQSGTMADPAFSVSVSGNVATIQVNVDTSITSATSFRIFFGAPSHQFGTPTGVVITQL
jgi:hypothetical protein